ncbi:MAG TPA: trypsin-like serine protease [Planctomycetes bacterium]|nr:trypsin-like serine protease [Planctomycetota bacterium]
MAESKLEKLRKTKKHSPINVVMVTLVIGFIVLIVCQLLFFGFEMQQRTRTSGTIQDGSSGTGSGDITLTASDDIMLVACSDDDITDAVSAVRRAIVNIDVAGADVGSANRKGGPALNFDIPSTAALQTDEETLGSGIIIDARGYILTCYHLIKDYATVNVTVFSSVRQIYKANVVDVDIANDLAVLKIETERPLPVAKLANSDMVKITDIVLAIGSPFGFEHTVTCGIISDNKRSIVIGNTVYEDMFQTDAAVNRGSAGGALINSEGRVVGVNTAIASPSGYFSGVSFAIPINKARPLLLKAIEG